MNFSNPRLAVVRTADGSDTIVFEGTGISYRSLLGALQESRLVFIRYGLHHALATFRDAPLRVFEMGFGTGLNTLLTAMEAARTERDVEYTVVEKTPLQTEISASLNHGGLLGQERLFSSLHGAAWGVATRVQPEFSLCKRQEDVQHFLSGYRDDPFYLVYWDAFAPEEQPELWDAGVFRALRKCTVAGGIVVTYSSQTAVRRAMEEAGFLVEKLAGPPGKRDVVRATAV